MFDVRQMSIYLIYIPKQSIVIKRFRFYYIELSRIIYYSEIEKWNPQYTLYCSSCNLLLKADDSKYNNNRI